MEIIEKTKAPDFSLPDAEGRIFRLSENIGKPLILYFYPKDDTPGCTTEACNFRDDYSHYQSMGIEIVGISPDGEKSHIKFAQKHQLPFRILSDQDHKVCEIYGVWGRKKMMGREYDGVFRTTFLINKEGMIEKIYHGVKPTTHSQEILEYFQSTK
jgi:peroxiredoxin Q/BCP